MVKMDFRPESNISRTMGFLLFCNQTQSIYPWIIQQSEDDIIDDGYPWKNVFNSSECAEAFYSLRQEFEIERRSVALFEKISFDSKHHQFMQAIRELPSNLSTQYFEYSTYKNCTGNKEQFAYFENFFIEFFQLGANISEAVNYDEAYAYAKQMYLIFEEMAIKNLTIEQNVRQLAKRLNEPCLQFTKNLSNHFENASNIFMERTKSLNDHQLTSLTKYNTMLGYITNMSDVFDRVLHTLDSNHQYLKNNLSKLVLANIYERPVVQNSIDDFNYYTQQLDTSTYDYLSEMKSFLSQVLTACKGWTADLLVNSNNVHQLEMVSQAKETNDSALKSIVESLNQNIEENLIKLYNFIFDKFTKDVEEFKKSLVDAFNFTTRLDEFSVDLRNYKDSLTIDTGFLL